MLREVMSITKALSDENRVRILVFLDHGELCVCQVIEMLQLAPSTVSKHLSILKQAGLVRSTKRGRWIYYSLADPQEDPISAGAIQWVLTSIGKDKTILEDRGRLKVVLSQSLEDLCRAYAG